MAFGDKWYIKGSGTKVVAYAEDVVALIAGKSEQTFSDQGTDLLEFE